jgi:midasin (ATPase involved in ribosome maturation)
MIKPKQVYSVMAGVTDNNTSSNSQAFKCQLNSLYLIARVLQLLGVSALLPKIHQLGWQVQSVQASGGILGYQNSEEPG